MIVPFGPYEDFDACLADPDLLKRYPDPETRRKVCGAMRARLEHAQAGEAAVDAAEHSAPTRVEETEWAWLVRDMVATRVGVNDQGLYKDPQSVEQTARSLDGAAVVYEHPVDADGSWRIDVDPKAAPGIAVNARLEGDAVLYDALVWKRNPPGHAVPADALAKNAAFAAAVRSGQAVHNSVGAHNLELLEEGVAFRMGSREPAAYRAKLVRAEVGHVAILAPVAGMKGGSCPLPWCGAVPSREQGEESMISRKHGDGVEQDPAKCGCVDKAADRVSEQMGVPRGAALRAIRDAAAEHSDPSRPGYFAVHPGRDPKEMSGADIDRELRQITDRQQDLGHKFRDAGREPPTSFTGGGRDDLSQEWDGLQRRQSALISERDARDRGQGHRGSQYGTSRADAPQERLPPLRYRVQR